MLINNTTRKMIDAYVFRPHTAALIHTNDSADTGKQIAQHIHRKLCPEPNNHLLVLDGADQRTIGVDAIRELQAKVRLRADKKDGISRVLAVYEAHKLTNEAQNALLKTIEETAARTLVLLVADDSSALLRTVRSRCLEIKVLPLTAEDIRTSSFAKGVDENQVKVAIALSGGNPDKVQKLLTSGVPESIQTAKQYLSQNQYERGVHAKDFSDQKNLSELLINLRIICGAALRNAGTPKARDAWAKRLTAVVNAQEHLASQVNTKLVLLNLSIQL